MGPTTTLSKEKRALHGACKLMVAPEGISQDLCPPQTALGWQRDEWGTHNFCVAGEEVLRNEQGAGARHQGRSIKG